MQIISPSFFWLLSAALLAYYTLPRRLKHGVLLVFTFAFFFLLRRIDVLAAAISLLNALFWTRRIQRSGLIMGIVIQVTLMLGLKCISFPGWITEPVWSGFYSFDTSFLSVAGLSFYSLQMISYMVEVYRRSIPRQGPWKLFLYLFFAPKFFQGPIERPADLLPQMDRAHKSFDASLFLQGLQWILLGLIYKLAIADRLAPYVSNAFSAAPGAHRLTVLAGAYLFSLQLYFDFAGYTNMAIGMSRLFGITLTDNFKAPFASRSITELWRRWHITLIAWLTEYIYTPLTFRYRRFRSLAVVTGIFCTFLLSGLWHGMGLAFLVWGTLHACFVTVEFFTEKPRRLLFGSLPVWVSYLAGIMITFTLFSLANIFFRTGNVQEAYRMLESLWSNDHPRSLSLEDLTGGMEWEKIFTFSLVLSASIGMLFIEQPIKRAISGSRWPWSLLLAMILLLLFIGRLTGPEQFIYRQF